MTSLNFDPIEKASEQWAERWGEESVPAMAAVTSVFRVQQVLIDRLNRILKPYHLSFARYQALILLYFSRSGELTLSKMSERLQVRKASITNLVDGLEILGYVTRKPGSRDRRQTYAVITERGRNIAAASAERLIQEGFGTSPIENGELEQITELLTSIRAEAGGFETG